MKKITLMAAACTLSATVFATNSLQSASANSNYYFGFHADMTSPFWTGSEPSQGGGLSPKQTRLSKMSFDQGGFQVGMRLGAFRTELGTVFGTSTGNTVSRTVSLTHLSIILKAAYDFQVAPRCYLYPIIGTGLAHTFKTYDSTQRIGSMDQSYNDFIFLIGAGTTVTINNKTSLSLEYDHIRSTGDYTLRRNGNIVYTADHFGSNGLSLRWNRSF